MADINITLTIPDEHVAIAWEAINAYCDTLMTLTARGHSDPPEEVLNIHSGVHIDAKTGEETNKEFAERWLAEYTKAAIKGYWLADDTKRYQEDVAAVDPPTQSVDESVIIPTP